MTARARAHSTRCDADEVLTADVAIIGGGLGGIAGAIAAADRGARVVMTAADPVIGGQITAQLTSPLDEHSLVESAGVTASYRRFRDLVRAESGAHNPGGGWVSRLCFEPRVGLHVLERMLGDHVEAGRVRIVTGAKPIGAIDHRGDQIVVGPDDVFTGVIGGVRLELASRPHRQMIVCAEVFVDATDLGDLLPISGCRWVVGSEGRDAYGEPDAVAGGADPAAEQACTWPAVLVRELEPLPVGDPPLRYAELRDAQPFSLDLDGPDSVPHRYRFFVDGPDGHPPFWEYRRVRRGTRDAAVINWAGNDFRGVGLVGDSERSHREARQLTLAFVHWLRTEVPRDPDDGAGPLGTGRGYPELRLAPELSGTPDGLASAPYVRESRRLANPRPVTWFDIRGTHSSPRPAPLPDSVGIAWYHADLHSRVGYSGTVFSETSPFQIPARALIPSAEVGAGNLLMGAKNLAATQVAASAYRVHPAEWAIGEAAGVIAAVSVAREISPRQTIDDPSGLAAVQRLLRDRGAPIEWPADVFASPWLMPEADTTSAPPSTTALARESPRPSSVPDLMRRDHA